MAMNSPLLYIGLACCAGVAAYGYLGWYRSLSQRRLIQGLPLSKCRSAAPGYVALAGRQKSVPGHPMVAPLTSQPCTWWSYTIETRDGNGDGWVTTEQKSSNIPLLLDDGTGMLMINPEGADVNPVTRDRWRGDDPWPRFPPSMSMPNGSYRYTETRMQDGDPLYVTGLLGNHPIRTPAAGMPADADAILDGWKRDQSALRSRFDSNGDGVVDRDELARARDIAKVQAAANAAKAGAPEEVPLISRPLDHRPFFLSVQSEQDIAGDLRAVGYSKLAQFIVFTLAGLWLAGRILR